jgi:hypothetical protein
MNFVEGFLGISPDGGNGMFEFLLLLIPVLLLLLVPLWRSASQWIRLRTASHLTAFCGRSSQGHSSAVHVRSVEDALATVVDVTQLDA